MNAAIHPVGVIGAGTMGAGIAQLAATRGWPVVILDVNDVVVRRAIEGIHKRLDKDVERKRLTAEQRDEILARITAATGAEDLRTSDVVIEAIVEDLAVKTMMLSRVTRELPPDAVIASNTSSLSITKIGESLGPEVARRVVGMHFFNPAHIMPLVEVVKGEKSSAESLKRVTLIAESWGKTVVRCNDTPGFIVNRVARPYYLEAFRILEDGYAGVDEVDKTMKDLGGFKMGPFELTDLIGHDINTATTQSVWEQLGKPARLKPSTAQMQLVKDAHLGRKTGRGTYDHTVQPPTPAIAVIKRPLATSDRLHQAIDEFASRATDQIGSDLEKYIFARVLVAIINEAAWAFTQRVASAADINTALKLGTNYPKGPLEWAEEIGTPACGELLDALNETAIDKRFASPEMLKAKV